MSALFLDTSGWFASSWESDPLSAAALARLQFAARAGHRLVTTAMVIAEMHALVLRRQGIARAGRFLDAAFDARTLQVVYPDEDVVSAARAQWIRRFSDQRFSLCDAVSFEVMRRERITKALATGRHFAIAGFDILR